MIFGMFGSKKKESLADLVTQFVMHRELTGLIGKAQSLQKLNRFNEADEVIKQAEQMLTNYLSKNPHAKDAHLMLVHFYTKLGLLDRAEPSIERALNSKQFELDNEEREILCAELQKIRRQRPANQRADDDPDGFTTAYGCAHCGRLHNYVSMPCPHCDWSPKTEEEMARSIILSSPKLSVPTLLFLARKMADGGRVQNVVPNLMSEGENFLRGAEQKELTQKLLTLLRENEHKNHRSLKRIRCCSGCGERILVSIAKSCGKCGAPLNWPEAIRALVCMDNLLWFFEQRIEPSSAAEFSEFVCVMVAMTNNLLRKQKEPSLADRQYCLQLLAELGALNDLNRGAVIYTKEPHKFQIYLVKDSMRPDSETYAKFLCGELQCFAAKMEQGIRL